MLLGMHVQSSPVAGAEDLGLVKLVAELYHGERILKKVKISSFH